MMSYSAIQLFSIYQLNEKYSGVSVPDCSCLFVRNMKKKETCFFFMQGVDSRSYDIAIISLMALALKP